jgi:hypothetical protein
LLPHLPDDFLFDEPCAGAGDLARHLGLINCAFMSDIEPQHGSILKMDAFAREKCHGDLFVTNPPWPLPSQRGSPTLELAWHLSGIAPTWLLLPSDFAFNVYFNRIASRCAKIVAVGRVQWIPDSDSTGKDNAAWYLFDKETERRGDPTIFVERR